MILKDLKSGSGKTVELGAGTGNFKEFKSDVISADIEACDWLDMCFDAHQMPFEDSSVANIVMIDVLHHLSNPVMFLSEAHRVLEAGGRVVMLEPFPSLFSYPVYKRFHPEPFIFHVDYFSKKGLEDKDPWDSNQAIPYLIFFKHLNKYNDLFEGKLRIIKKNRLSCIIYPLSGGFENKALIPDFLIPFFRLVEWLFTPFRKWFAFRCYVVIEKLEN
jgi:SAM-dependent methyltransferase